MIAPMGDVISNLLESEAMGFAVKENIQKHDSTLNIYDIQICGWFVKIQFQCFFHTKYPKPLKLIDIDFPGQNDWVLKWHKYITIIKM